MLLKNELITKFVQHLIEEEKSAATIEKYRRDIRAFAEWLSGHKVDKSTLLDYKSYLMDKYSPASVNSVLSSLNGFFEFYERYDLKMRSLKIQRHIFCNPQKELSRAEYEKLLKTAKARGNTRLYLLMQTICGCGLRVSELKFITVEAIKKQHTEIKCKGKIRQIFLPEELCRALKKYARDNKINSGSVFITRNGNPLDRSNIWSDMKKICKLAGVLSEKVFPHNLRHLFARTFYSMQKDIVRLADILGHSNINTTRIYTMETGENHQKQIQRLGLLKLLC